MPAAQLYVQSTTVTSNAVTVTIPAGPNNQACIVIDNITATGQSSTASGVLTLEHNIAAAGAVIFSRRQLSATVSQPDTISHDWSGGWPIWKTTGDDGTVGGATDIVLRGTATLSNACLTVTFHYAMPSDVRS